MLQLLATVPISPQPRIAGACANNSIIARATALLLTLYSALSILSAAEPTPRVLTSSEGASLPKSDRRIENLIRDADIAARRKHYDAEISKLSAALDLARDERTRGYVCYLRANAYRRKNDFARAMQDANEAVRLFPKLSPAFIVRGRLYDERGEHDKAIADFDRALQLNPYSVTAKFQRAIAYGEKHDSRRSLAENSEILRLVPGNAATHYNRGVDYAALGQFDKALADYNEAIRLQPQTGQNYYGRGQLFARQKKYAEAAADFATALRKGINDDKVLNSIAWTRATFPDVSLRNAKQAIQLATKACEKTNWQNSDYLDTLAAAYAEAGAFDLAIKYQTQSLASKSMRLETLKGKEERLRLYQEHEPYREQMKKPKESS